MKSLKFCLFIVACLQVFLPIFLNGQTSLEEELFHFINQERKRALLKPLLWDSELYPVARSHSLDMSNNEVVSHTGSDGSQPHERIYREGIFASKTAENIARDINMISAHTMLMQSLDHRENILDPEISHVAVSVVEKDRFLYVTELFIQKLLDYGVAEVRSLLLKQFNFVREERKLAPFVLSESLNNVAQSHVEFREKFGKNSQMLVAEILSRQRRGAMLINVYTTTSLFSIPMQLRSDLLAPRNKIGIGFRRVREGICNTSCYLIVLIFN